MAQQPVVAAAPAGPEFFARTDFHLNAAWLGTANLTPDPSKTPEEQRFAWDSFWGGSIDVVDYVGGRLAIIIDYEAVFGSEFQPFDPNQGNYTLEASASARLGATTELVGIYHHVSRHLSDRAKTRRAISYNVLGARLLRRIERGGPALDIAVDAGRAVDRTGFVDYTWVANVDLLVRGPLTKRLGWFAHSAGRLIAVDSSVANRTTQTGGLIEAGVHINGGGGALELFAGAEKRIDAYPLDRVPQHWFLAGFRLLNR
jgi:hypothetical protein